MATAVEVWGYKNPDLDTKDMRAHLVQATEDARVVRQELGGADWQATPGKVANLETRMARVETTLNTMNQKLDTLLAQGGTQ